MRNQTYKSSGEDKSGNDVFEAEANPIPREQQQQYPEEHGSTEDNNKEDEYTDRLRVNLAAIDPNFQGVGGSDSARPGECDFIPVDREGCAANLNLKAPGKITIHDGLYSTKLYSGFRGIIKRIVFSLNFVVPYGGLLSSSLNLASATLGAGIISTPSAFNLSGVVMSCVYLVLVTVCTVYSMNLIAKVIVRTGFRTFSEAARHLLGPGVDHFLAGLLIILCFGGSVAYIIAASTLLFPILNQPGVPAYLKTRNGNRLMTCVVWLTFMLPLVIPKRINSLRYVSTLGVVFIIFFVATMIAHSITHGFQDPEVRQQMVMVRTGNAALEGLGVFLFALLCQINGFEIFHEMRHRTVFHFTLASAIAMGSCAVLYFLAGFFGYADFGNSVKDSVLKLYDPMKDFYIGVGYICIIVKICVAFALHMIPFRDAIYHFVRWSPDTVPYWKHALVMAVPTTAALLCGIFIPTINTVLGLLGSFCGGIIGIIMPVLFHMYCGHFSIEKVGAVNYLATYLLLIAGCISVVFGTVTTIYSTVQNSFS